VGLVVLRHGYSHETGQIRSKVGVNKYVRSISYTVENNVEKSVKLM
jgi:hypothetical protein